MCSTVNVLTLSWFSFLSLYTYGLCWNKFDSHRIKNNESSYYSKRLTVKWHLTMRRLWIMVNIYSSKSDNSAYFWYSNALLGSNMKFWFSPNIVNLVEMEPVWSILDFASSTLKYFYVPGENGLWQIVSINNYKPIPAECLSQKWNRGQMRRWRDLLQYEKRHTGSHSKIYYPRFYGRDGICYYV